MSELEDVVKSVLDNHVVRTTRIGGGEQAAPAARSHELLGAVRERTNDEDDLKRGSRRRSNDFTAGG